MSTAHLFGGNSFPRQFIVFYFQPGEICMKRFIRSKLVQLLIATIMIVAGSLSLLPGQQVVYAFSAGDWPTFLVGPARTSFNKDETIINPTTAHNLKVHWTRTVTTRISAEPV